MQTRRRTPLPPWERQNSYPRHPLGQALRRWPQAYERRREGQPRLNPRYRRAYDGAGPLTGRRRSRRPGMQRIRQSPVRNGLIGLAIAGAAAPVAINRYQQALRTDPAHERITTRLSATDPLNDRTIMERWGLVGPGEVGTARIMEATGVAAGSETATAATAREAAIDRNLERHSEYKLGRAMAEMIHDAAVEAGVDPDLAFGLVKAESGFRNTATSPVGAIGLTQLMPRTAAWMSPGTTPKDLRNPKTNLRVGFKYLSYLTEKYNGNENLALLAYNRGPGTVDRAIKKGGDPDNGYADFVRGKPDHGHTLYTAR